MIYMTYLWEMFFSWMPWQLQAVFMGFLVLALIVLIIRIVGLILNAVPFL